MALANVISRPGSDTAYLTFLIDHAVKNNFSVAVWRLPHQAVTQLIIGTNTQLLNHAKPLEDLPHGFIFAPFEHTSDRIFIPADYTFSFSNGNLNSGTSEREISSIVWLDNLLRTEGARKTQPDVYLSKTATPTATTKATFIQLVSRGITSIENGHFEKVVLSRTKTVNVAAFNVTEGFQKLSELYSNALISFVSTPETGSWLGATPEVLVSVKDKKTFRTTALAGTQPYSEGTNLKLVAWTQKDIEEQALVERYIINCFKKIRLREYDEHGPRTVVAGNLMHLKSDFTVDMEATNFPQLGSVMLQLLHPTSAVCGVPLDTSLEFIRKNENYDREYYTGYLGPVNFNNSIDIFVNLRCLQVLQDKVTLYAGAGITQDSIPENEWDETELKLKTLLKIIE